MALLDSILIILRLDGCLMFRCVPPVSDEPDRAGVISQTSERFYHATGNRACAPEFTGSEPLFRQERIDVA
jgi:hypothetical protein